MQRSSIIVNKLEGDKISIDVSSIEVGTVFWGVLTYKTGYTTKTKSLYYKIKDVNRLILVNLLDPLSTLPGDRGMVYDYEQVNLKIETTPTQIQGENGDGE